MEMVGLLMGQDFQVILLLTLVSLPLITFLIFAFKAFLEIRENKAYLKSITKLIKQVDKVRRLHQAQLSGDVREIIDILEVPDDVLLTDLSGVVQVRLADTMKGAGLPPT